MDEAPRPLHRDLWSAVKFGAAVMPLAALVFAMMLAIKFDLREWDQEGILVGFEAIGFGVAAATVALLDRRLPRTAFVRAPVVFLAIPLVLVAIICELSYVAGFVRSGRPDGALESVGHCARYFADVLWERGSDGRGWLSALLSLSSALATMSVTRARRVRWGRQLALVALAFAVPGSCVGPFRRGCRVDGVDDGLAMLQVSRGLYVATILLPFALAIHARRSCKP